MKLSNIEYMCKIACHEKLLVVVAGRQDISCSGNVGQIDKLTIPSLGHTANKQKSLLHIITSINDMKQKQSHY